MTVGEPGAQGAGITGMQGIGVSTPAAAVVAAATVGLVGVVQRRNGLMFAIGAKSMIVPANCPPILTGAPFGIVVSTLGAVPKVHIAMPVLTTSMLIALTPLLASF